MMLAGGADAAIIPSGMGGFIACKALSCQKDSPEKASRPWDKARDGFVMGEGAGTRSILPMRMWHCQLRHHSCWLLAHFCHRVCIVSAYGTA